MARITTFQQVRACLDSGHVYLLEPGEHTVPDAHIGELLRTPGIVPAEAVVTPPAKPRAKRATKPKSDGSPFQASG